MDSPAFASDRADLARTLGGDDAARRFLGDPDAVTRALRDYVWSIGVNGGTAPAGAAAPGAPAVREAPARAATTRRAAKVPPPAPHGTP